MHLSRVTLATASSVLVLAMLSACGSDTATDSADAATGQTGQEGQQGQPGGGAFPGASGKVAAVSGKTAQVQSQQSGQVAVSWTDATTFNQEVDGTLDDVQVGSCVRVTTDDDSSSDSTEVAASTVRIVPSTDGQCGGGMGGPPGGGAMPSGAPSDMPTDMPSNMPGGSARPGWLRHGRSGHRGLRQRIHRGGEPAHPRPGPVGLPEDHRRQRHGLR